MAKAPSATRLKGVKGEKPTYHSKQVQLTQKLNEHENQLLRKDIRRMERSRISEMIFQREEKKELFSSVKKIKEIRTKAPVTPERKMFLRRYGVKLTDKFFDMDEFISVMDEEVSTPKKLRKASSSRTSRVSVMSPLRLNYYENEKKDEPEDKTIDQSETHIDMDDVIEPKPINGENSCPVHGNTGGDVISDVKGKTKVCTCVKNTRTSYIFRRIEPPVRGRVMTTNNTRSTKQTSARSRQAEKTSKGGGGSFDEMENMKLREEANEYRLRLLSRHKMRDQFVPISTLPLDLDKNVPPRSEDGKEIKVNIKY